MLIRTEFFICLLTTFHGNILSPSSGWFNLVQMYAEVMCSSKCVNCVGQFKGVWLVYVQGETQKF